MLFFLKSAAVVGSASITPVDNSYSRFETGKIICFSQIRKRGAIVSAVLADAVKRVEKEKDIACDQTENNSRDHLSNWSKWSKS
jgi:hypothetical protein